MVFLNSTLTRASTLVVMALLVILFSNGSVSADSHEGSATLSNGAEVQIAIASPSTGDTVEIQSPVTSADVAITGSASVGIGVPGATIIYVMDESGSTQNGGGTGCAPILDCEQQFFLALNDEVVDEGTITLAGVVRYGTNATIAQELIDPTSPAVGDAINAAIPGGYTNCAAGLAAAYDLATSEANTNGRTIVVLAADSPCLIEPVEPEAAALGATGAIVHSVAIGFANGCTTDDGMGTLTQVTQNGGSCTSVADAGNLPDIIGDLISWEPAIGSTLDSLRLTVDGVPVGAISNDDIDANLPQPGATSVTYSTIATGLEPGEHKICVTARGSDVLGDVADAIACVQVEVIDTTPPVYTDTGSANLSNGAELRIAIDSPSDGEVLEIQAPDTSAGVAITGSASIGLGESGATIIYVMDESASTGQGAGTGCEPILECEKQFFLALNDAVIDEGSVNLAGVVHYGTESTIAQELIDPTDEAVNNAINAAEPFGFTNCAAGLADAYELATSTANTNERTIVVFASDGICNEGTSVDAQAAALGAIGAIVHTVAIGTDGSCTDDAGLGTLEQIAQNGGSCTEVSDPSNLPEIIDDFIGSTLESLELTVDGANMGFLPNDDIGGDLPVAGASTVAYSTVAEGLEPGAHQLCVTANGSSAMGDTGNATACVEITIELIEVSVPLVSCEHGVNPSGKNKPGGQGAGFYELVAISDGAQSGDIEIYVNGLGRPDGTPFRTGDVIKYTQVGDHAKQPVSKRIGGPNSALVAHIISPGAAEITGVGSAGVSTTVTCPS